MPRLVPEPDVDAWVAAYRAAWAGATVDVDDPPLWDLDDLLDADLA